MDCCCFMLSKIEEITKMFNIQDKLFIWTLCFFKDRRHQLEYAVVMDRNFLYEPCVYLDKRAGSLGKISLKYTV